VYAVHLIVRLGVRRTLVKVEQETTTAPRRPRLNKDRVLRAAVALADEAGIEALSMRKLAEHLGVVPMALYKHVADKEELLDGMIDIVIGEVGPPADDVGWKGAIRQRILSARQSLRRHPWAPGVIESRKDPSPAMLAYIDSVIGMFLAGGFSISLTHHALHALGSRLYGFTPEVFDDSQGLDPQALEMLVSQMQGRYPHVAELAQAVYHDEASVVGEGCDDQFEFEFALDLLLDGLDRLRERTPH
jgi:AcrR family transcriptional regulator